MNDKINAAVSVDLGDNLTNLIEQLAIHIGTTADNIFPIFGGLALLAILIGAVEATGIVGQIMNPNYYAIQQLTADLEQFVK